MDVVNLVDVITKGVLRVSFGLFLVWIGFSIHNTSKNKKQEPVYIEYTKKDYTENEKKVIEIMDSVINLPTDERKQFLEELADKYSRQYLD